MAAPYHFLACGMACIFKYFLPFFSRFRKSKVTIISDVWTDGRTDKVICRGCFTPQKILRTSVWNIFKRQSLNGNLFVILTPRTEDVICLQGNQV